VAEKNYGGQMVEHVLESTQRDLGRIILVESRRGKQLRAEPVVALYEKAMVVHAGERGTLMDLEDEQTSWIPGHGASPNRVDALVHGVTSVAKNIMPAAVASPTKVLAGRQMPVPGDRPNLRLIS
jgi:phage terminase large subunit-like protein